LVGLRRATKEFIGKRRVWVDLFWNGLGPSIYSIGPGGRILGEVPNLIG